MSGHATADPHQPCRREIDELKRQVADLRGQVAALLERLNQNSQNSSSPPSSDPPSASVRPAKRKKVRKFGGQPGHSGHQRLLLPVDKKNVRDVKPVKCRKCGTRLAGEDDPNPY